MKNSKGGRCPQKKKYYERNRKGDAGVANVHYTIEEEINSMPGFGSAKCSGH